MISPFKRETALGRGIRAALRTLIFSGAAIGAAHTQQITALSVQGIQVPPNPVSDGNLYGASTNPPGVANSGGVYKLAPSGTVTSLATFLPSSYDNDLTPNGTEPISPLVAASDGNLYGLTASGGANGQGTIYRVSITGSLTLMYTFGTTPQDGYGLPDVGITGMIQGTDGALYGTTGQGGVFANGTSYGTVFKMTLQGAYQILHRFIDGSVTNDGEYPSGPLVQGTDDNFYGATAYGGSTQVAGHPGGQGTIFRITPTGSLTIVHNFHDGSVANDGIEPSTGLLLATDGNFYGLTNSGGTANQGTLYRLAPTGSVTVLHSFGDGTTMYDGLFASNYAGEQSGLVEGPDGYLYGTAPNGGFYGNGAIFKISLQGQATTILSFSSSLGPIGFAPTSGLSLGADRCLYGSVSQGTNSNPAAGGTLFKLSLAPVVTSPATVTFAAGIPNSFTVSASGSPAATFSATGLPSWAHLNSTTGALTGTPLNTSGSPFAVTISAANGFGAATSQTLTLTVQSSSAAPALSNGPPTSPATVGLAYAFTYQSSGTPSPTFTLASGTLPPGLMLSTSGVLSGTPTQAGTFTGQVSASNGVAPAATQNFSISVQQPAYFTGGPPPNGSLNVPYNFAYQTGGTPATYSFYMTEIPDGLSFNTSTGALTGTPTSSGTYTGETFIYNGVGGSALQNYSIVILQASQITSGIPPLTIPEKTFYSVTCKATGTPTPTFSLSSGTFPPGMNISATGTFSGIPTQSGTFTGTISAGTGSGTPATQPFSVTILPNPLQSYAIIHNFSDPSVTNDGRTPNAPLIQGTDGNFYGTTTNLYSGGTIFRMTPQGVETVLHVFGKFTNDGLSPTNLVQGLDGNFYGVTQYGGANGEGTGSIGNGTAFKMTPDGTTTIIHNFGSGTDGVVPSNLILGWDGNFYGTTGVPNSDGTGEIFKMTTAGVVTPIATLSSVANSLVEGFDGNFYGTTIAGGVSVGHSFGFGAGTIFKVQPGGSVTYLHDFGDGTVTNDGVQPSSLTSGLDGNFYGTTYGGGSAQNGTIFKVTSTGTVTILRSFSDGTITDDGGQPCGIYQATDGNLYGTTYTGGYAGGASGVAWRITPQGAYSILHEFDDSTVAYDASGNYYAPAMVEGADGGLYYVSNSGGLYSGGAIVKLFLGLPPLVATAFTSANNATFLPSQSGNFTLTASGSPAPVFIAAGLPPFLTLNQSTGVMTGTPPSASQLPYTFILTAYNAVGSIATQNFTLYVPNATVAPVIISAAPSATLLAGTPYTFTYQANADASPSPVFALTFGSLPPGLSLSSSGVLSGTPSKIGTYTGSVTASNGISPSSSQPFTFTVGDMATVTLSHLTAPYTGKPIAATATTVPARLLVTLTYNGSSNPPTAIGSYTVVATIKSTTYTGSATGTLTITPVPPMPVTKAATAVTANGATLNAAVNPKGTDTMVTFQYGPTIAYGNVVASQAIGAGSTSVLVSAPISLLTPSTIYHFRVVASNGITTTNGSDRTFITLAAPVFATLPAVSPLLSASGAQVGFAVTPGGVATSAYFRYSTDPNFGSYNQTGALNLGSGKLPVVVNGFLGELVPNTTYYYDLVTASAAGTFVGPVESFTTLGFDLTRVVQTGDTLGGSTLSTLGSPILNGSGEVAFAATLSSGAEAIFADDAFKVLHEVAQTGMTAPDTSEATFLKFSDPVQNENGAVAFSGTIKLASGQQGTTTGFWSTSSGNLRLVARPGGIAPGTDGATFKTLDSLALSDQGAVVYGTLNLSKSAPVITSANDAGIWQGDSVDNLQLVLQTGETVWNQNIRLTLTGLLDFSPNEMYVGGQTRNFDPSFGGTACLVTLSDGTRGIVTQGEQSSPQLVTRTGATYSALGSPTLNDSDVTAFAATLTIGNGVTTANDLVVDAQKFPTDVITHVAQSGLTAPGTTTTFASFSDPVMNAENAVAFRATLKVVKGQPTRGLWATGRDLEGLALVVAQGTAAPGCPAGATFADFTEMALTDQFAMRFLAGTEKSRFPGDLQR